MAVCGGCSGSTCNCVVDGVTITGDGTAGDPFVAGGGTDFHDGAGAGSTYTILSANSPISSGINSIAIGILATATNTSAIALGDSADATGISSIAIGEDSFAAHADAIALGQGATTTAANQIMLGTAAEQVHFPGTLKIPTGAALGFVLTSDAVGVAAWAAGGGGGGDAIVTVAASDTPAIIAAFADFTCDGVDDQIEIQAAIDSLGPASGGLVRLLQGTFNTTAPIIPATSSILEGSGRGNLDSGGFAGGTVIFYTTPITTFPNAHAIFMGGNSGTTIRDLVIECLTADTGCITAEVSEDCIITNCFFYQDIGGNADVVAIGGHRGTVSKCTVYGWESVGIHVISGGDHIWITDNIIQADTGIFVDGGDYRTITGNQIQPTDGATDGHGIRIYGTEHTTVTGNTVFESRVNGIQIENGTQSSIISNNIVRDAAGIGIHIAGAISGGFYNIVHNNIIQEAGSDGIRISGVSEENSIQNNMIRFAGVAINILGASAVSNLVTNNDHKGMTITDTGTATIFTAGNRP